MHSLMKLFRRLWDIYPKEPLVYICTHNGVTGVVGAEAYDDEIRRMRRQFKKKGWPSDRLGRELWSLCPVRPQVYPIFLFSDKNPSPSRSFRVGTMFEMAGILKGCRVEERTFELPPLNAPGSTRFGYYDSWEEIGRENTRHRRWTLDQARMYLNGGTIFTYNL